jgi:feruloyl esterase
MRHPGVKIVDIQANDVRGFNISTIQNGDIPKADFFGLDFCNVTVTYVRESQKIPIELTVWLPRKEKWNGRFQGTGGGGFVTGYGPLALAPAIAKGYSASSTNGGTAGLDPSHWALDEDNEVDMALLEQFAQLSLVDLARIGKEVTQRYFGRRPAYSYWSGCSTGGRQGMMLAQRYPNAFDGILALAPAINWPSFQVADYWPQQVMNELGYHPEPCELELITRSAIRACDGIDGRVDNIISSPGDCNFNVSQLIGQLNGCSGEHQRVTKQAAKIAMAAWHGPVSEQGRQLWPGLNKDAALTGLPGVTTAETNCSGQSGATLECKGQPFVVAEQWIKFFVQQDPEFDLASMNRTMYEAIFNKSVERYQNIIGTADTNLTAFCMSGVKILSWQGLADQLVPPNGTAQYYNRASSENKDIGNFYRLFFAPGTRHCEAGSGPYPYDSLDVLIEWVEDQKVPDILVATTWGTNETVTRPLCPFPKAQIYVSGDPDDLNSYKCE